MPTNYYNPVVTLKKLPKNVSLCEDIKVEIIEYTYTGKRNLKKVEW
jgi:hypothetical protein